MSIPTTFYDNKDGSKLLPPRQFDVPQLPGRGDYIVVGAGKYDVVSDRVEPDEGRSCRFDPLREDRMIKDKEAVGAIMFVGLGMFVAGVIGMLSQVVGFVILAGFGVAISFTAWANIKALNAKSKGLEKE